MNRSMYPFCAIPACEARTTPTYSRRASAAVACVALCAAREVVLTGRNAGTRPALLPVGGRIEQDERLAETEDHRR